MSYDLTKIIQQTICDEIDKAVDNTDGGVVLELSRMLFAMMPSRRFDFDPFVYTSSSNRKIDVVLKESTMPELNFSIVDKNLIKA